MIIQHLPSPDARYYPLGHAKVLVLHPHHISLYLEGTRLFRFNVDKVQQLVCHPHGHHLLIRKENNVSMLLVRHNGLQKIRELGLRCKYLSFSPEGNQSLLFMYSLGMLSIRCLNVYTMEQKSEFNFAVDQGWGAFIRAELFHKGFVVSYFSQNVIMVNCLKHRLFKIVQSFCTIFCIDPGRSLTCSVYESDGTSVVIKKNSKRQVVNLNQKVQELCFSNNVLLILKEQGLSIIRIAQTVVQQQLSISCQILHQIRFQERFTSFFSFPNFKSIFLVTLDRALLKLELTSEVQALLSNQHHNWLKQFYIQVFGLLTLFPQEERVVFEQKLQLQEQKLRIEVKGPSLKEDQIEMQTVLRRQRQAKLKQKIQEYSIKFQTQLRQLQKQVKCQLAQVQASYTHINQVGTTLTLQLTHLKTTLPQKKAQLQQTLQMLRQSFKKEVSQLMQTKRFLLKYWQSLKRQSEMRKQTLEQEREWQRGEVVRMGREQLSQQLSQLRTAQEKMFKVFNYLKANSLQLNKKISNVQQARQDVDRELFILSLAKGRRVQNLLLRRAEREKYDSLIGEANSRQSKQLSAVKLNQRKSKLLKIIQNQLVQGISQLSARRRAVDSLESELENGLANILFRNRSLKDAQSRLEGKVCSLKEELKKVRERGSMLNNRVEECAFQLGRGVGKGGRQRLTTLMKRVSKLVDDFQTDRQQSFNESSISKVKDSLQFNQTIVEKYFSVMESTNLSQQRSFLHTIRDNRHLTKELVQQCKTQRDMSSHLRQYLRTFNYKKGQSKLCIKQRLKSL